MLNNTLQLKILVTYLYSDNFKVKYPNQIWKNAYEGLLKMELLEEIEDIADTINPGEIHTFKISERGKLFVDYLMNAAPDIYEKVMEAENTIDNYVSIESKYQEETDCDTDETECEYLELYFVEENVDNSEE